MKKRFNLGFFFLICCLTLPLSSCSFLSEKAQTEDSVPLRIMLKMGDSFVADNNVYIEWLEQQLDVKLEIEAPSPSSYNDRLNVMMAVGDLPDIVQLNWTGEGNFPLWVEMGLVKAIDLSKAPNIESNVPKSMLAMMQVGLDDQIYAVPGITTSYPYGVAIRQDWLDALGLEPPRTLDDYVHILERFTRDDPDKNGKDDTIGITSWRLNHFGGVFGGAFQIDYLWNSIHKDVGDLEGIARLRERQSGYLNFLDFAKAIYENDLLDKSFTSLQNAEDKFVLGKVGMIGAYSCDIIRLEEQLRKSVPDARLEWLLAPGDINGRVWNFVPESYGYKGSGSMFGENAIFFITKNADYDKALSFLDRMNSKEMIMYSNLGIQGIHYEEFDANRNRLIRTPEQKEAVKRDLFGISDTYRGESHAYIGNNEDENARLDYYRRKGYLLITNPYSYNMGLVPEMVEFQQNHPFYKEQERLTAMKYIIGEITREQLISFIEHELSSQRETLSQKVNEKYLQLTSNVPIR